MGKACWWRNRLFPWAVSSCCLTLACQTCRFKKTIIMERSRFNWLFFIVSMPPYHCDERFLVSFFCSRSNFRRISRELKKKPFKLSWNLENAFLTTKLLCKNWLVVNPTVLVPKRGEIWACFAVVKCSPRLRMLRLGWKWVRWAMSLTATVVCIWFCGNVYLTWAPSSSVIQPIFLNYGVGYSLSLAVTRGIIW